MTRLRFNPNLLKVPLYITGKSVEEMKARLGLEEVIKLASNESSIGPSPMAIEALMLKLGEAHRYPGISEQEFRHKLATTLDPIFTEANFATGNGGTDILRMITQVFVFDGGNTIMAQSTFPMYHILTTAYGGEARRVPLTKDFHHDFPAMAEQIDDDTRIIFLCSPNNPTGYIITQAETDELLAHVPDHVVVVFDESYHSFVTDPGLADTLGYIKQGRNVLVVRSFSKTAGLANLRVGYAVGPEHLIHYLHRAQLPFQTGAIALAAAAASLDDHDYMARNKKAVTEGRTFLYNAIQALDLKVLPSQANFLAIVDPPMEPASLCEALLQQGIIVRLMETFGMPNAIRVTVGTMEENKIFVSVLQTVLKREPASKSVL